eukprot:13499354-Heterocapsa_arctica.AAC.1
MIEVVGKAITGGDNRADLTIDEKEQKKNVGGIAKVSAMSLTSAAESAVCLSVGDIQVNPTDAEPT